MRVTGRVTFRRYMGHRSLVRIHVEGLGDRLLLARRRLLGVVLYDRVRQLKIGDEVNVWFRSKPRWNKRVGDIYVLEDIDLDASNAA